MMSNDTTFFKSNTIVIVAQQTNL